jgi:hypothetical protein
LSNGSESERVPYSKALASSTLYTTLDDYARFAEALLRPRPGSPFALEEIKQAEVRGDIDLGWALGVAVEDTQQKSYFHWGANPGFPVHGPAGITARYPILHRQ